MPDILVYVEALRARLIGTRLLAIRRKSPFLLRTAIPPIGDCEGLKVEHIERLGKRIAIGLEHDLWLVFHLMIAGRLHWSEDRPDLAQRFDLAAFDFETGSLRLYEAGPKKRASLHVVDKTEELERFRPPGLEPLDTTLKEFTNVMARERRTLKRFLTDQRLIAGIGNAYSDEILHSARLSPITMTDTLVPEDVTRLFDAMRDTLTTWHRRLQGEYGDAFPGKVTAFRPQMAVHGRYGKPCPICETNVQRIRHAANETNYCPRCQTGGRILADRGLSRLLKSDWPKNIEELEARRG